MVLKKTNKNEENNNPSYNNMRVIGWDIGIKNLAYCIVDEYNESLTSEYLSLISKNNFKNKQLEIFEFNGSKYLILDWGIVNIVEKVSENMEDNGELYLSSRPKLKCNITNAKNKQCSKNAIYCKEMATDGEYFGYCNAHFLKSPYSRLPRMDEKKPSCYWSSEDVSKYGTGTHIDSANVNGIIDSNLVNNSNIHLCNNKATFAKRDNVFMSYCTKHKNEIVKSSNSSNGDELFLKIKNVKKSTSINLTLIGQSIFQELDTKSNLLESNLVLLENQPVLKNPTMKSIQMFMYSYYIMRGVEDNTKKVTEINCYSANNKTELDAFIEPDEKKIINDQLQSIKDSKGKRKKKAILLTNKILENCPNWLNFFKDNKKRDDLADSFLMSLHYLNKNKKKTNKK